MLPPSSAFFMSSVLLSYAALHPSKGLIGGYGPVFEEQPQNTLFPESSEEQLTLSCRARAIPPAAYRWKLNGTELNLVDNPNYQLIGGNLAISNPTQSKHTGTYQCVASNPSGTVLSNEASLRFGYLQEFPAEDRDPIKTTQGWGIMLPCNPPQHYPALSYRWLLNESPTFLPIDNRYFVSQVTGNLYISHTKAEDEGGYSCLTTSHIAFTTKSVYSSFVQLTITPSDPRLYAPSIKLRFPAETYTLSRQSVTLECFAFGNPTPSIRWRKVDTTQAPQWFSSEPVLHIQSVSFDDDGTYECEAENSKGRDTYQGRVIVQAQPEWLQIISDTEAKIGSDLIWNCAASGKPRPTIRWLRDGKPLMSQTRVEINNGQLKITNLDLQDSGMYQCVAGNKHGTIYTSAELSVQALAPDFRLSPVKPLIPAARGGEITILCNPRAAPSPVIVWSKGTELLRNSSRVTVTANGTLILKNISRSDEGNYTCFAENLMGKSNSTGILSVREATRITLAPSGSDINQGDSVTLQCHASHDPTMDLTFTWELEGVPINFEKEEGHYKRASADEAVGDLRIVNARLRHAGKYTCTAQTVVDRASASSSLLVRGPPGPPGGVVVRDVRETSVQLSWSRGFDNHNPISRYMVQFSEPETEVWKTARTDPATVEGNAESALVVGLTPWTDYLFRVVASNILGVGEPSVPSAIIRTKEAAPNVAPSGVIGGGGAPNELTINWTPLGRQYQNGDGFGYIIAFKRKTEDSWQMVKVPGTQPQHFVYRNESIAAYTPFDVMIKAFNQKGEGPYSLETTVYSAEEEPTVYPSKVKVTAISSSEIEVEWKSVATINGVLLGYEIRYWKAGDKEAAADRVRSASLDTVARVNGLKPDTLYHVTVRAYNRAGTGPPSPTANITTNKAPPNRPPGNISWTLSRSTVSIKWDPVIAMKNESSVTGYKMLYRLDSHSAPTLYVTSKTRAELPFPEGASHVTIQLRATGSGGDGESAEVHIPTDSGTSMMVESSASHLLLPVQVANSVVVLVLLNCLVI